MSGDKGERMKMRKIERQAREEAIIKYWLPAIGGADRALPQSDSIITTLWCLLERAIDNGVWFQLSCMSVRTSFRLRSIFTTRSCPCRAAHKSGVRPYSVSTVLGLVSCRP